jgi:hypothetical protein
MQVVHLLYTTFVLATLVIVTLRLYHFRQAGDSLRLVSMGWLWCVLFANVAVKASSTPDRCPRCQSRWSWYCLVQVRSLRWRWPSCSG